MNNSDRDPDAYDRIREDKLTEQKPEWPVAPDGMSATVNARLQEQAARIASLEAQLAAANAKDSEKTRDINLLTQRERGHVALLGDIEWVLDKEYLYRYCPECEEAQSDGHADGCRIAAALDASEKGGAK